MSKKKEDSIRCMSCDFFCPYNANDRVPASETFGPCEKRGHRVHGGDLCHAPDHAAGMPKRNGKDPISLSVSMSKEEQKAERYRLAEAYKSN